MGDLHGNAPDRSPIVLLIVDVINDLEFPGGAELAENAVPMAQALSRLARRVRQVGAAVIYANDNFGRWRSDFRAQLRHCLDEPVRGRAIVELLRPEDSDYFVLKPKHSAFYSTALDLLLHHLEATKLIIAGMATESCVLFTANDAYVREYDIIVPSDCVASAQPEDAKRALDQMRLVLKADVSFADEIDLAAGRADGTSGVATATKEAG
jgi:nicotinamidase-related amidase